MSNLNFLHSRVEHEIFFIGFYYSFQYLLDFLDVLAYKEFNLLVKKDIYALDKASKNIHSNNFLILLVPS